MSYRRRGLVLAALVSALLGAGSAHAAAPPSLAGEVLSAGPNSDFGDGVFGATTHQCNEDESGSFTFIASGQASGPYPGTFVESGSVTVDAAASLVVFHSDFTITSASTTIRGTKDLVANAPENYGGCYADSFSYDTLFNARSTYTATINGDTATYRDTGSSTTYGEAADTTGFLSLAGPREGPFGRFQESFDSSNGVVPVSATGKFTGGGWIQSDAMNRRVTFGFEIQGKADGIHVTCTVVDHQTKAKIKCLDAQTFVVTGNQATFSGTADVDGAVTTYTITVVDNGEPGRLDTFSITTGTGYAKSGLLLGGDTQAHKS
jgi:hypothetical protein